MLVEYSLSPEFKFPVAIEQIYAALCWIQDHGKSMYMDPNQIVIAGDSAGGNMATVVSSKLQNEDFCLFEKIF